MQSYLERYQSGEYVGVWAELVAFGPAIRDEPVYADAQAVALEMMMRAKHNIALLVERLEKLEYRFLAPDSVWTHPDTKITTALDTLEGHYGLFRWQFASGTRSWVRWTFRALIQN